MVKKTCEICKKDYYVIPSQAKRTRFCSKQCCGKWHINQRPNMGNRFTKGNKLRTGLKPANAFVKGENIGKNHPEWVEPIEFTCEHCGKKFSRKPWIVRQNGSPRFCNRKCFESSQVFLGSNSPVYVGGIQTYRGRNWLKTRLIVIERQEGKCAICGKYLGKSLPIHHKNPFREYSSYEEANNLDNLIGYCQSCHMKLEPRKKKVI